MERLRNAYEDCLAPSCEERHCSVSLEGIPQKTRAVVHGSKYQKKFGHQGKLCDRLVFWESRGVRLAAVELKGGKNVHASKVRDQIQNGLMVAEQLAEGDNVTDWRPLLAFSGHVGDALKFFIFNPVRFKGKNKAIERKAIERVDCGTPLLDAFP